MVEMDDLELYVKSTSDLTTKELLDIMAARIRVFVVEQKCAYQEVDDKDYDASHVMLKKEGQLLAYTRIVPHDDSNFISFGRVFVVQQQRGNAFGQKIVDATIQEIRRQYPNKSIKIAAQSYLQQFYSSFGFEPVSNIYLEDNIPHIDMLLVNPD